MWSRRLLLAALTGIAAWAESYRPVHEYDPQRDGARDIREALAEAKRTDRRVLVEVGGLWCSWCRLLDRFFVEHPEITNLRDRHYVMVKVNYDPEHENKEALSKYPKPDGYPHFFVVDGSGALVRSQNTGDLEEGKGYSLARMKEFLERWAAPRR